MKWCIEVCQTASGIEAIRDEWNRLDGDVPFRSYDWLSTWWGHYGPSAGNGRLRLHVLVVRDATRPSGKQIVAIAPWYAEATRTRGTVLRQLGGGEVCSDHVGLLSEPNDAKQAASAIADHLCRRDDWNRLELEHLDDTDAGIATLAHRLAQLHCETSTRPAGNTWAIDLSGGWDGFLAMQSKSHRKQLRRAQKQVFQAGRGIWQRVENASQFDLAWQILVDLHQRRWTSLGERGCFASHSFTSFHYEVARKLLARGALQLGWLELDGAPVAAEYQIAGGRTTFAYQGAIDPARLGDEPGRLATIATICAAIDQGYASFDFLRGDEPYKAHWRALPCATYHLRAIAPQPRTNWFTASADWADSMASAVRAGLRPIVSPGLKALQK